jgi:hypothetical protein
MDFTFVSLSDETGQSLTAFSTTGGSIEVQKPNGLPEAGKTASNSFAAVSRDSDSRDASAVV